ncbi:cytosolic sulfotransferase 3-like [Xyrichtys novacula]|uniref:Sulfotransferase n=1 Tax=Xyrichtys novacula TaxID=13765 RepID=A0AAV1HHG5_XYRNO|nr:cytosolic sulfotransferase 3-like [Xyrichtys novacula]
MDSVGRPELFDFHKVPMTHQYTENWENLQNFRARPDDILIATYPKAGNTWLSYTLDLLYFGQTSHSHEREDKIFLRVPMLESTFHYLEPGPDPSSDPIPICLKGTDLVNNLSTSPRLIKTHLPVQFIPKSFWEQNCRIFYVGRNAKDIVTSYFNFERMSVLNPDPGDWSSYFQRFMDGKVLFGSWYDHVNGWWKKKQTYSCIHYMFYEDLIEDTARELDKICSFLGLSPTVEEKESIVSEVQFDAMKKNKVVNHDELRTMKVNISPFMRKGKVGDWKNHFTVAQNEEFDKHYEKKMKDPILKFRNEI